MTVPRLNATAAALLGLLHDGPMTGWDLMALAQERIGEFWSLTRSQVYRELTALAGAGLVTAGAVGPRDRRPFQLTAAGRAAFSEWLEAEPGEDQVRIPLLLTLAFADHLPADRLEEIVAEQRRVHEGRLTRYRTFAAAPPDGGAPSPARLATLAFGLRHEEAVLGWFDDLPAVLAGRWPPGA